MRKTSQHNNPHERRGSGHAIAFSASGLLPFLGEYGVLAVLTIGAGAFMFRAAYQAADDALLSLLAPLMAFIVIASLFTGDDKRRK